MILVRHAHAGSRSQWHHDDSLRPLSERGHEQAALLIKSLCDDQIDEVWTSSTVRCRQTVAPLCAERGLTMDDHHLLAKGARPDALLAWVLAHAAAPWLLCTHGEVFEALLRTGRTSGLVDAPARATEKGAAWRVSSLRDGSMKWDYLPPRPLL